MLHKKYCTVKVNIFKINILLMLCIEIVQKGTINPIL